MRPEDKEGVGFTRGREHPGRIRWFRRIGKHIMDGRGVALIMSLFILFAMGMMMLAFSFSMQSESVYSSHNRNSTEALNLAEAGILEAVQRIAMFGATPGSAFPNSLASGSGVSGTVTYQAALQNNPQIFPILSVATFAGAQRGVRLLERAIFKNGFNQVILSPQINAQSSITDVKGDTYTQSGLTFQGSAIQCGSGATATNLVPPQVSVGTTIAGQGAPINSPCGATTLNATFTTECASGSLTEVAPTPCTRSDDGSGNLLPVHFHPMVPIGMRDSDFNAVVTAWNGGAGSLPPGISVTPATQNGTGVTYTPAGGGPSYWTSVPSTNGKVMLITATQPFCVNDTTGTVSLPIPAVTGTCPADARYYGNQTAGTPNTTRFVDWGLVTDDLTRAQALKFFQAPACTAPCANPGNQNGIRYIPRLDDSQINIIAEACKQHVNPGTNVFDQVNLADGVNCSSNPAITTISSLAVTFSGTKSNPEALVIDNKGAGTVAITGSLPATGLTCTSNWDPYNWGMIIASGDISITSNFALTGFIYAGGNIDAQATLQVTGGIFEPVSKNGSQPTLTDGQSNLTFCGGQTVKVMTPLFVNFSTVAWQDRPLDKP